MNYAILFQDFSFYDYPFEKRTKKNAYQSMNVQFHFKIPHFMNTLLIDEWKNAKKKKYEYEISFQDFSFYDNPFEIWIEILHIKGIYMDV